MENVVKEDVLQALTEFDVKNDIPIPSLLEEYLHFVASTGDTVFPWNIIKVLVRRKIEQVLCDFLIISSPESVPASPNVDLFKYALMKEKILEALEYFTQAPFTIQRLCEVMVDPKRYYKRIDKLMRAMEKNLLVTTTTEPRRPSSPNAHMSGVMNGYEDRTNGHHLEEQEDEPMGITGTAVISQPTIGQFSDSPMTAKTNDDDEEGIEDIDVDQTPDVISSQPQSFDITMVEMHQGESSQENLLQIQLQMREQQQRQLIIVNVDDQAGESSSSSSSSSQSSEKAESVGADVSLRPNENSCSNDTNSDVEQSDTREAQLDIELEQQVPQFVLCEGGDTGATSPLQFQSVSSQTQEVTKTDSEQQSPSSSSTVKTDDSCSTDGTTDQISVVESSQVDSIDGNNEAAAGAAGAATTTDNAASLCLSCEQFSASPTTTTAAATTTTTVTTSATTTAAATTTTTSATITAAATTATIATTAAAAAATTTTTKATATTIRTTTMTVKTAITTGTTTLAISPDHRTRLDVSCSSLVEKQQGSVERGLDEAELSTTGSPENEAVAKE